MYQYYYLGVQDQASSRSVYTLAPHGMKFQVCIDMEQCGTNTILGP